MADLPATREACDELIAQITKHRDSLPKHPIVGHLYRLDDGEVFIAARTEPVLLIELASGTMWSSKGGFDGDESDFTHLGPAADHLQLQSDAPKMPDVTDAMAARAWNSYADYAGDRVESMRHVLTLYREGKL